MNTTKNKNINQSINLYKYKPQVTSSVKNEENTPMMHFFMVLFN